LRIEEITKLNLRKAPDIELYSLDLRFSQLWEKYFEKPKPKLEVKRGDFLGKYQLLVREMHKRKINHVETGIDDIVFKKEELGIDTPSLGSIVLDPEFISIVRDSKKSLRDQPDINILIRDEQDPKLELALTKLFGKQINKKLNFIYDMTEWDSYIPLFEKVLRPKEKIEIVRKRDDIPETGFIEVLGTMAQLDSPQGRHFSLLIRHKDKRILIDPAVHKKEIKEELDFIIVTQADKDHWEYLVEYKNIPVYTVGAIFDRLPKSEDTHLFLKPLKIDGLEIIPIKTTPAVGTPSIGLRLDVGKKKISILPEFLELGKAQKDLVKGTIWICGVGDYETEPEKEENKLSFLSLLQLAEELKPKAIYLTNLRKDILKNKEKVNAGLKIWNGKILYDGDVLEEKDFAKREGWGLNKPAYRIFTFEDLKNTPHFQEGKAIVEAKFDGMRTKIIKKGKDVIIMSDPEDIKGSPIKTKRLPWQVEELKKMKEDFEGDAEVIMIDKEKNECLHRTATNALLNGKFDPTEASKKAHIYIFDIVEHEGKNIRDWPLKERKELLNKFKDSEHVHFVRSSTNLQKEALSYIVDLGDLKKAEKAKDKIIGYAHKGGPYPKHIAEGVMIKLLNTHYEAPQDHGACKWKERYEIDCLVVGEREIIREGKKTGNWNYELAVGPIDKEWAEAISRKDKKAVIEFREKFYNHIGKSDNTKQDVVIGSILRVASEDVNSYETDDPKYPYYKAYVSVVLQPVPEKNVPDKIFVLERLSGFTPRRERLVEKAVKDDVKISIEEGKIPKEIYKEHAKENEPLPKEFYSDYREGEAFIQTHIRGLEPEEVEEYKKGKITLAELFEGHSIHLDDRMSFSGLKRLVQWVITDNNVESYLRMLKGELVETASGMKNVAKSFALVKPSAEEPGKIKKIEEIKEPSISKKGAKILADLQIKSGSYFISPGEVGCVSANDLILTDFGYEFVRNLRIGDRVYTGEGKFKPIKRIWDRGIIHERHLLKGKMGLPCLFYNHDVFTRNGIKTELEITESDKLLLPKPKENSLSIDRIILEIEPSYKKEVELTEDALRWIGFFIGDGSIINHDKGVISLDCTNDEEANSYESLTKRIFNVESISRLKFPGKLGGYVSLRFYDRGLAKWLSKNCYYHSRNEVIKPSATKKFPDFFIHLPKKLLRVGLEGYIDADGARGKKPLLEIGSTSRYAIGQSFYALLRLGILSSLTCYHGGTNHNNMYSLRFQFERKKEKMREIEEDEKYYYIPVAEQNNKRWGGGLHIYDLEIDTDSNFVISNFLVKNSTSYRYAWMGLIWRGKVKSGIGRKDYHEYFYYPGENLPEKNKELVKGRYVVKAFKRPKGAGNYWQVWKATEGFPADPIEHRDSGYYVLVPAKDLKAIGRERYRYGRKEPV